MWKKLAMTKIIIGHDYTFGQARQGNDAYLNNASQAMEQFGYPAVPADTLIRWQAEWVADGGRNLGLPTHFEERGGSY